MTQLGVDSFIRANTTASSTISSGWGTASDGNAYSSAGTTATWQIVSNQGKVTGTATDSFALFSSQTPTDTEMLVRVSSSVSNTNNWQGMFLRYQNTSNTYYAYLRGTHFSIGRILSNTHSNIADTLFTQNANTEYWIRFRAIGTTLMAKVWADGTAEPNSWTLTVTDTNFTSGRFGIYVSPDATGTTAVYDSFYAVDYIWCDTVPISDSFSATDGASFTDANTISDSMSGNSSYIPSDNLSISDAFSAQDSYSTTEGLSALDAFLAKTEASWVEVNPITESISVSGVFIPVESLSISDAFASIVGYIPLESIPVSDGFLGQGVYIPVESLTLADLQSALQSWGVDALVISDSFSTEGAFTPVASLNATDMFLATDSASFLDALTVTDLFSGTATQPAAIIFSGTVVWVTRDGQATWETRDELVIWKAR